MAIISSRILAFLFSAAMLAAPISPVLAQSNSEQKPSEQKPDSREAAAKRIADELAEAGRVLSGPAANPECVWIGRRAVRLMSQDDLDTAFRHLELYDRFGCPGGHVQAAFRCLIRQGMIDPKSDSLDARVHNCWVNPLPTTAAAPAAAAPAPSAAAPAPAAPAGTGTR